MPWCPKCKTEYRSGFTICVDCDIELVDELKADDDYEEVVVLKQEATAKKLVEFLTYSNITSYYEYSKENQAYSVYSHTKDIKKAKKCFQAFYTVELEEMNKQENTLDNTNEDISTFEYDTEDADTDDTISDYKDLQSEELETTSLKNDTLDEEEQDSETSVISSSAYVKKSEQYKDLKSTAITFLAFGIGGFVFLLLNVLGVINFINGPFALTIMSLLFLGFLYVGFNSISRSKKAAADAVLEDEMTTKINSWLEVNITEQVIHEMQDETVSQEANFIKIMDRIKEQVKSQFGDMNDAYLDVVVEEFYNEHFE